MEEVLVKLVELAQSYPTIVATLSVIGALRIVMKPLFSLLHKAVDFTPSNKDNVILASFENNKVVKALLYFLDLFASVKLKK